MKNEQTNYSTSAPFPNKPASPQVFSESALALKTYNHCWQRLMIEKMSPYVTVEIVC